MAVRIQKPAVNIREKLAELERPIGVNGAALMATNTPQDAFSLIGAGRKNILINGDMQIWQRGTSFLDLPNQGATNYTADRWNATRYASGDHDVTRQEVNYLGFQYALRSERSTGDSSNTSRYINQPIESSISRTLAGKHVTLSFYARIGVGAAYTIAGGHVTAYISYHTDNGWLDNGMFYNGFKNAGTYTAAYKVITLSTDFQKFELTGFIPSNVRQIGVAFGTPEEVGTAIANDYFEITGVQLEEGRTSTSFEFLPFQQEFALCQRYYEKSFDIITTPSDGATGDSRKGVGVVFNSTDLNTQFFTFAVTKRTSPSITFFRPNFINGTGVWAVYQNGNNWADRPLTAAWVNEHGFIGSGSVTSGTSAQALIISGNWSASAEL
jgi:hypothetical protein